MQFEPFLTIFGVLSRNLEKVLRISAFYLSSPTDLQHAQSSHPRQQNTLLQPSTKPQPFNPVNAMSTVATESPPTRSVTRDSSSDSRAGPSLKKEPSSPVSEQVSRELTLWEKIVFSFDMDRDGASGSGGGKQGPYRGNDGAGSGRSSGGGASGSGSGSGSGSNSGRAGGRGRAPTNPQIPPGFPYPGQVGNQGLGGLDHLTLAQLAALSALSNPQAVQQQHASDPYQIIRQMQGLLQPGAPAFPLPQSFPPTPSPAHQQPIPQQQQQPPGGSSLSQHPSLSDLHWAQQFSGLGQLPLPQAAPPLHGQHGQQQQHHHHQQLPPLMFPGLFPPTQPMPIPSSGANQGDATAGPSRLPSSASASPTSPTTPGPGQHSRTQSEMDDVAISEDKRRRNTAASARFRIKKKHKVMSLERSVVELEGRADDLEREAAELRRENGWLKEMLIMKGRRARAVTNTSAQEEEEEEEPEDSQDEDDDRDDGDEEEASKAKGKGKAKERSN